MIRDLLNRILKEYLEARNQPITKHPLAKFIRDDVRLAFQAIVNEPERYQVKASVGRYANWAQVPWIATMDVLVTETAQSGYYVTYLFKSDMSGIYLNLNQGVTDIKKRYKIKSSKILELRATDFRAQLGSLTKGFDVGPIDLLATTKEASLYEVGSICSRFYPSNNMPNDAVLISDYRKMIELYSYLVDNDTTFVDGEFPESKSGKEIHFEDTRKKRKHERIERNPKLIKAVKKYHGYKCQACNFNFVHKYGEIGRKFIEAHHLVPLSKLGPGRVALKYETDFAVLCSNCHRMIHKLDDPSDLAALKAAISKNK